jgi:hypothetical protein
MPETLAMLVSKTPYLLTSGRRKNAMTAPRIATNIPKWSNIANKPKRGIRLKSPRIWTTKLRTKPEAEKKANRWRKLFIV